MVYRQSDGPLSETAPLQPTSPYGVSKLAQERLGAHATRENQQHVVLARVFNHLGPRQDDSFVTSAFARQIAEIEAGHSAPVLRVGNLEARRDFTDVRDTVRAYELLLARGRPGEPYNVCSGHAYAVGELLATLMSFARRPITVLSDPALYRPSDQALLLGDNTRLREELGWRPTIPIQQSLLDLLEYWRKRVSPGSAC